MAAPDVVGLISAIRRHENVVQQVADKTREKLVAVVDEQFASETDPDGSQWEDGPNYHGLIDSAEMLGSLSVQVSGSEITMSMNLPFQFHQKGTVKMPQRKIFPDEGDELPPKYQAAVDEAFTEVVGK
jgi:hypothetical protein